MSFGSYQEYRLINLLYEFDEEMAESYLNSVSSMMDEIENIGGFRNISWIKGSKGEPLAFRTSFNTPLFLMISHPISRFSKLEKYRIYGEERQLCLNLAIVPTYLATLDVYTVVKLWNEGAKRFFSPTAEPLPEREEEFWHVTPARRGAAQFSSMDWEVRTNLTGRNAPISMREILRNYFRYTFWSFPKRGFSCCAHFLNDSRHIHTLLKNAKTIYGFEKVYDDTMLIPTKAGYHEMEIQRIDLWGLQSENLHYKLVPVKAVLTRDIAQGIQDFQGRFFINGVVAEFRRRGETRFNTLTVVAEYGVNSIELQQAVIGQVVSERFKSGKSMSYIGSVSEIKQDVDEIVRLLSRKVQISRTMAVGIKNARTRFDLALSFLKPIVVVDDGDVLFCHPFVLGSLYQFRLFDRIMRYNGGLANALRLLDKIPTSTVEQLRRSAEAKFFSGKGMLVDLVIRALQSCVDWIRFSKILKKIF